MAAPIRKAGASGAIQTGVTTELADRAGKTVTVEGTYADLEAADPASFVPSGYVPTRAVLAPAGGGMGKLTISCVQYETASVSDAQPVRETIEIDMEEVTYDLIDHPHLDQCRAVCAKWLATDEAKRVSGDDYFYTDDSGTEVQIQDAAAIEFCAAYMAGIKSFVRYYPVIERTSVYKNPPGITRSGRSFTGGTPKFSAACGKFDAPPLTLSGYAATNWFRGGDRWRERGDTTWELQEKWTYTPDGSTSAHAWIYTDLARQNGGGS